MRERNRIEREMWRGGSREVRRVTGKEGERRESEG